MNPPTLLAYSRKLKTVAQQVETSSRVLDDSNLAAEAGLQERERIQAALEEFAGLLVGFVTECASVNEGDMASSSAAGLLTDAALQITRADSSHLQIMGRAYLGREQDRLNRELAAIPLLAHALDALGGTKHAPRPLLSGCADNIQEWFRSSKETGQSYIVGPSGALEKVTYSKIDGMALYEGCIELGPVKEAELATTEAIGVVGEQHRWPDGTIYYRVASNLPNKERVTAAIAHWQEKTPLKFVPWTDQKNYVSFVIGDGCSSPVGMQGGEQFIRLAAGCSLGATIHEIGHCVGLWHEQSRHDRDDYITINFDNIESGKEFNFDKHISDGFDIGSYDCGSIMHYPATAFSKNGKPTIVAKGGEAIGQRVALSAKDLEGVKVLYPNLKWK